MKKQMESVKELVVKLCVDLKSLLQSCLPHILVHILPLSAAAAADQQVKLTAVGFECYNMLKAELGKQVLTIVTLCALKPVISRYCLYYYYWLLVPYCSDCCK